MSYSLAFFIDRATDLLHQTTFLTAGCYAII